jgi:2-polyprenyl-3-methyl-5-hydroxy-6-metoxy-1,4-benzoquinol methylase
MKQHAKQFVRRTIGEPYVGKRLKLRRLERVIGAVPTPTKILDAGGEDAAFVYWLADRYPHADVTMVDIDKEAIAACEAARPARYDGRVHFQASYFADVEPESVDLVTAFDVLEHIEDDLGAARDLWKALKPGGTILVHVPSGYWRSHDGTVVVVPDDEAWKVHSGHVRSGYTPERMSKLLTDAGFEVVDAQRWIGKYGAYAHHFYSRFEHPVFMRALTVPVTDICAALDARRPDDGLGNSTYVRAIKPA